MTLDEFTTWMSSETGKFYDSYMECYDRGENYPLEMELADWIEQIEMWIER